MSENFEQETTKKLDDLLDFKQDTSEKLDQTSKRVNENSRKLDNLFENILLRMQQKLDLIPGMQKTLVLIEDQVMNKIPALFEGYSIHLENQEKQQKELNVLDQKVENHDIRILYLEQKI